MAAPLKVHYVGAMPAIALLHARRRRLAGAGLCATRAPADRLTGIAGDVTCLSCLSIINTSRAVLELADVYRAALDTLALGHAAEFADLVEPELVLLSLGGVVRAPDVGVEVARLDFDD